MISKWFEEERFGSDSAPQVGRVVPDGLLVLVDQGLLELRTRDRPGAPEKGFAWDQ